MNGKILLVFVVLTLLSLHAQAQSRVITNYNITSAQDKQAQSHTPTQNVDKQSRIITNENFTPAQIEQIPEDKIPCHYKSIGVPPSNGHNQKLQYTYNPHEIASVMRRKPGYMVNEHYTGYRVVISRIFNDVKYNIVLETYKEASQFNLNTYNFETHHNRPAVDGEECSVPDELIKEKVYQMIDDLPLTPFQSAELKKYVRVKKYIKGGGGLFLF